jgi:hypothetical protein
MLYEGLIGKTIGGRYQIEALLGQGGMSAVYRALDPNLRRTVAIKLIHPHLATDPNFIGRFKEEAAAVARLRHPNIVQVHDFNNEGETYYMVMEYLVGETLEARLRRLAATSRQMPFAEAIHFCAQICDAAGYAHNHELVHRDIKPANIMLDVQGQAILMDFGIVKIIGGDYHTSTGATLGTAMYMSPEQIRGERIDDRSDIYSLGATLYEMLSGHPPYRTDSVLSLMMMILNDPLPDLRQSRADVPEELLTVVNKALAKDPAERFQRMAEMAAALRRIQVGVEGVPQAATMAEAPKAAPVQPIGTSSVEISAPQEVLRGPQKESTAVPVQPEVKAPVQAIPIMTGGQAKPAEAVSEPIPAAEAQAKPAAKKNILRYILIGAAVLLLLAVAAGVVSYFRSKQPPKIALMPIIYEPVEIDAQTAQNMVNLGSWELDADIMELAISPDGTLLGTANDNDWQRYSDYHYYGALWNISTGKLNRYLLGHTQWVTGVAFSPDGKLFATTADDEPIFLWDVQTGTLEQTIKTTSGGIADADFSPSSLLLAAGTWSEVGLWQVSNGSLLRSLSAGETGIKDVEFSPDGSLLAAACDNGSILIWKVSDGSIFHTLEGHTAEVRSLAFSPDGAQLASASEDQSVRLWQVSDGSLLLTLTGHSEAVNDVVFSKDGSILVSASDDYTVNIWQVSDGQLLRSIQADDSVGHVAISPDGSLLAAGLANRSVQFWGISAAIPLETP